MSKFLFTETVSSRKEMPLPIEKTSSGGIVQWGNDNAFPEYIWELYSNSSIFSSIIQTIRDYVMGDGIETTVNIDNFINRKFETLEDLLLKIVLDYLLYDGFAIQVIRNRNNEVAELNHVDIRKCRINEEENTIYYGDFSAYSRKNKLISYPRFTPNTVYNNSIFFYKGTNTRTHYPIPSYYSCLRALEISTLISEYNLNTLNYGFTPSCIVNMNNGIIGEEEMEEIQEKFEQKFFGVNGSKLVLSFNNDAEHQTTIERMPSENDSEKYTQLLATTREEIFSCLRINPILVGINNSNSGFTKQEFSEAYTLFQRTVIQPVQKRLERVLETLFNTEFKFKPFSIQWEEQTEEENKLINIGDNN